MAKNIRLLLLSFACFIHIAQATVSQKALLEAKDFLKKNEKTFPNQKYFVIIDYSQASNVKRFHLIETASGKSEDYLVAHGKGSDPKFTGYAKKFGDQIGSRMTSLGFFKTTETYMGQHGYSLKLEGMSATNKNALKRAIVVHAASYVSEKRSILGRSWGCPAIAPEVAKNIIDKIKNGALVYSIY